MRVRILGDRDRLKPFSLKGRDTIQGAGLLRRGCDASHAEILPDISRGDNTITSISINILRR